MYTEGLEQLKERLKKLWDDEESHYENYLYLLELAYKSGSHDGFYNFYDAKKLQHDIQEGRIIIDKRAIR